MKKEQLQELIDDLDWVIGQHKYDEMFEEDYEDDIRRIIRAAQEEIEEIDDDEKADNRNADFSDYPRYSGNVVAGW